MMPVTWNELLEGSAPETRTLPPVTRTDFVRYQGASGDMNPIHHDEPFARAAGFDAPLGVGMFPAGALANFAAGWLGPTNVRRTRIRWKAPVFPGAILTMSGHVARKYEENGERKVDLELACAHADGTVAVQCWMTFVVQD